MPKYGTIALEFTEDLCLDGEESGTELSSCYDAAVDSKGTIYVLDGLMAEVVAFDRTGHRICSFGRRGEGPGEFSTPFEVTLLSDDEVCVVETYRVHMFHADGVLRATHRNEAAISPLRWLCALAHGGRFGVFWNRKSSPDHWTETLSRVDSLCHGVADLVDVPTMRKVMRKYEPGLGNSFLCEHAYTPRLLVTPLQPDRLVYARSMEYAIHILDNAGDTLRIIRRDTRPHPISDKEKRLIIQSIAADPATSRWPTGVLEEAIEFPDHRPFISSIITDDAGRIHVCLQRSVEQEEGSPVEIDIYARNGTYLYRATSPFFPGLLRDGHAYRVTVDPASGAPRVTRLRMDNWDRLKIA